MVITNYLGSGFPRVTIDNTKNCEVKIESKEIVIDGRWK
jgi:hypothetical protein